MLLRPRGGGLNYEIYNELDSDGIDEYRFRVREANGKILLSASERYLDMSDIEKFSNYNSFDDFEFPCRYLSILLFESFVFIPLIFNCLMKLSKQL